MGGTKQYAAGNSTTATTSNNMEHAGMVVIGGNSTNQINMGPHAATILVMLSFYDNFLYEKEHFKDAPSPCVGLIKNG